jgi:hypothetical protein
MSFVCYILQEGSSFKPPWGQKEKAHDENTEERDYLILSRLDAMSNSVGAA